MTTSKHVSAALAVGLWQCAAAGELVVRPGAHAEFPLRPSAEGKGAVAPLPESVTFRPNNLDDLGMNRTVQEVAVPTLTVYRPERPSHRGAALVVCPGGGYSAVVIDREGHAIARFFAQQGLTVAVLKYRLPAADTFVTGLPASQQDALEAVRVVRRRAEAWGVAKDRVGIMGFSAGGHLAGSVAVLGEASDGSRPDFAALLYPVIAMDGPHVHAGSRERLLGSAPTPERVTEWSLERRARKGLPPFFFAHAKDDKAVPYQNSACMAEALQAAGVRSELLLVASGGHGFSLGRGAESAVWKERFLGWLDTLP